MPQGNEPIKARSATALADGEKVILQITAEDGAIFTFEIPEPLLTLDTLRNAESIARAEKWDREAREKFQRSESDADDL